MSSKTYAIAIVFSQLSLLCAGLSLGNLLCPPALRHHSIKSKYPTLSLCANSRNTTRLEGMWTQPPFALFDVEDTSAGVYLKSLDPFLY